MQAPRVLIYKYVHHHSTAVTDFKHNFKFKVQNTNSLNKITRESNPIFIDDTITKSVIDKWHIGNIRPTQQTKITKTRILNLDFSLNTIIPQVHKMATTVQI